VGDSTPAKSPIAGLPPGLVDPVLAIVRASSTPVRRRKILEELERRGHRISLAGLNRILEYCAQTGRTQESPDGVRLRTGPP
jgi:hypothetical protein